MFREMLTVRINRDAQESMVRELAALQAQLRDDHGLAATLWTRYPQRLDMALQIHHEDPTQPHASPLGLRLADGLRAFGTVDHALWVPLFKT